MRLALGAAVDPIARPQARNHSWRPGAGLSVPIQREPVKTHRTGRHDRPTAPRAGLFAAACLASLPAHASFLSGDALDSAANVIALVVICIVPIVGIAAFWMVHVLPEKVAHKRHHPQRDAIQVLCLLSLAFGGLLWPLAWLWAYSKPVLHKLAYGTDKHDDYYARGGCRGRRTGRPAGRRRAVAR